MERAPVFPSWFDAVKGQFTRHTTATVEVSPFIPDGVILESR
jgi:hypothetical protein